ncbi:MAG: hypothetical protein Q8M16_06085 [Pirellulaceae bacterium]|nr:hypothetical protein [Pirellulaceae bacterium]
MPTNPIKHCGTWTFWLLLVAATTSATNGFAQRQFSSASETVNINQDETVPPKIKYHTDPQQAIITMDVTGGFRAPTPADFKRQPTLQVFGDGRIVCGTQSPNRQSHDGRLTPEQLQELVEWLVRAEKFLEISPAQIAQELDGYQSLMADGPTITIKLQLTEQAHEHSVYTLKQTARDLPDATGLQTLARIETRLRSVKQLGDIGSQDILDSALSTANKHLEQELPDANPWTAEQIRTIQRSPNGGLVLTFSRAKSISGDGYTLMSKLTRATGGDPWQIEFESR